MCNNQSRCPQLQGWLLGVSLNKLRQFLDWDHTYRTMHSFVVVVINAEVWTTR